MEEQKYVTKEEYEKDLNRIEKGALLTVQYFNTLGAITISYFTNSLLLDRQIIGLLWEKYDFKCSKTFDEKLIELLNKHDRLCKELGKVKIDKITSEDTGKFSESTAQVGEDAFDTCDLFMKEIERSVKEIDDIPSDYKRLVLQIKKKSKILEGVRRFWYGYRLENMK